MAYVYRHIRLDKNQPFYIGIGKTKYRHSDKSNRNNIWNRIVAKTQYEVEILFDDVSWEFAKKKEIEFIALYGRIDIGTGILANMTNGGDGNLGIKHSEEALRKISESSKNRIGYWNGKKMSDEARKRMSNSKSGKPIPHLVGREITKGERVALVNRNKGNKHRLGIKHTERARAKISQSRMGRIAYNRRPVLQYSKDGVFIKKYACISDAKNEMKISDTDIIRVCKGQRKTAKGYIWKYEHSATIK